MEGKRRWRVTVRLVVSASASLLCLRLTQPQYDRLNGVGILFSGCEAQHECSIIATTNDYSPP